MANCVSASARVQHMETQINSNNDHLVTKAVFIVNINFLRRDAISGQFEHSSLVYLRSDYFKGRFQLDNRHLSGIHPRLAMMTHHR